MEASQAAAESSIIHDFRPASLLLFVYPAARPLSVKLESGLPLHTNYEQSRSAMHGISERVI